MKDKREQLPSVNEQIRSDRVQLIAEDGDNVGVISRNDALRRAREAGLDLVMLAERGSEGVPVVKIMDFGKALYERKKKKAEAKKHQKVIQVKEIKMSTKIGEHDYQTKMKHAVQFLNAGKRVKVTLTFRGRENITKEERGTAFFEKIDQTFEEHGLTPPQLVQEKDTKMGPMWSRIYYLKEK